MTRVHILGAETPTPTADRFGSSYVLDLGGGRLVMFFPAGWASAASGAARTLTAPTTKVRLSIIG